MAKIGLFYGTTGGTTKEVAEQIQTQLGRDRVEIFDVTEVEPDAVDRYSALIFGAATMGVGDLDDMWDEWLPGLAARDLAGKTVALFGLGDQDAYPDSFVDAMGDIYDAVVKAGATVVGRWPTTGYDFEASRAHREGAFVGLVVDEDNQAELTLERVKTWVNEIKGALG